LLRILLAGEDGVAGGYIDGDWTTRDLLSLFEFALCNEALLSPNRPHRLTLLRNRIAHALRSNTVRNSRRNIAAHYDLGNAFFRLWLDADLNYSAALYQDGDTLEGAQQRKLDRIADLLMLGGGERVLEIGCGWGALAARLIERYRARVTGVTLSTEQLGHARQRLAAAVANGQADLRLQDYRDIAGSFDRVASIEMIEAVGERYWPVYFAKLRNCLRPGGVAVIQAITIAESRFPHYRRRPDFIQRYIFPGGMLPTPTIIRQQAKAVGLDLVHCETFGASYARTLREWRIRFLDAAPKLETLGLDHRFRRMWEYYLAYCEVGFRRGVIDVGLYKFAV
jgi:cyclopropane-fatty-acyl-phospholipid synthase